MLVYKRKAIGTRYEIPLRRTASRFFLLTSFDPQKFDAGYALAQDDTQWEMRRIAVGSFSFSPYTNPMERTSELSGAPVELFVDTPSMPAALLGEHSATNSNRTFTRTPFGG